MSSRVELLTPKLLRQQQINVQHKTIHFFSIGAIAKGPHVPVFVNQNQASTVVEAAGRIRIFHRHAEIIVGDAVNLIVVAGHQTPAIVLYPKLFGVVFQRRHGIVLHVDGMGKQHDPVVVFIFFINAQTVGFYLRANSRAVDKEEIHDVDFIFKSCIGHQLAVLIDESEIRDGRVNCVAVDHIAVAENGQGAGGGTGVAGKKEEKTKPEEKKLFHVEKFVAAYCPDNCSPALSAA